jgi:membrane associated rhomboid family serine protease
VLLPLGDSPNPPSIPLVTYGLIAANLAVFVLVSLPLTAVPPDPRDPLLQQYVEVLSEAKPAGVPLRQLLENLTAYDLYVFQHGFRPVAPSIADLFYSLFLHAGLMHLVGNMLFLWIYGDNVEHQLGRLRYLVAYLGTGVAATLFHTAFASSSPLPLVGASGAISGVLGFYFLWFPHNRVRLFVFLFPFFLDVVTVPARLLLGVYLILDNLVPFVLTRDAGGVAHGAHIGGFVGGLAAAWVMNRRDVQRPPPEYSALASRGAGERDVEGAIAAGDFADAAQAYFSRDAQQTRRLLSPAASLALADWLARNEHQEAALTVYRRHLRDWPHEDSTAEAHLGAGLLLLDAFGQPAAAYQHLLDVLDLAPRGEVAARARAALERIRGLTARPERRGEAR